ncbi:MAG: helix-turn-helix domain-containing protein [Muribaculaceae bacterium]|nr:helix-turn-helix domain-containing protein [Muribaculaceae bacterium]
MNISNNSNNILSILDNFTLDDPEDISIQVAENFRKRRVEKNITRKRIAELSGVALSTVTRFEQRGLIAFESLIKLAMALGYTSEIKDLFGSPKFDTMEELERIRHKRQHKRAYTKSGKR